MIPTRPKASEICCVGLDVASRPTNENTNKTNGANCQSKIRQTCARATQNRLSPSDRLSRVTSCKAAVEEPGSADRYQVLGFTLFLPSFCSSLDSEPSRQNTRYQCD